MFTVYGQYSVFILSYGRAMADHGKIVKHY